MLPLPTERAVAAFLGSALALVLGVLGRSELVISLGGTGLLVLAGSLAATFPVGRRVRRERLEFAWWLGHGDPGTGPTAAVPGVPLTVRCYVRHRGERTLWLEGLEPLLAAGARLVPGPGGRDAMPRLDAASDGGFGRGLPPLQVRPRARTEFAFCLAGDAVGRIVLHGLAVRLRGALGLYTVPLYFPNPLAIKVLPRAAASRGATLRVASDLPVDRSGRASRLRRGGGSAFYELRERKPGDPYRAIAWKASARLGKLVVREVEREVQEVHVVLVDVTGSMRGGPLGARKIDYALDVAAFECRRGLLGGDVVGLATIDDRVLAWIPPRDDAGQMIRIYDALVAATEVVDEDLTEVDDLELAELVGRYVRNQDGIDFARGPARSAPGAGGSEERASRWDLRGLVKHVRRSLEEQGDDSGPPPVASSPDSVALRRFCRVRGIPVPHRVEPRDGAKGPTLAGALRRVAESRRGGQQVLLVTDFDGVVDFEPLVSAAKLLRTHGHQVRVLFPDARAFRPPGPSEDPLERDLGFVFGLTEARRFREARAALARAGVPVLSSGPRRERAPGSGAGPMNRGSTDRVPGDRSPGGKGPEPRPTGLPGSPPSGRRPAA